jgi:hypothetical protein
MWPVSLDTFAAIHAPRLELPRAVVRRALWGEWYWKPKTKQIVDAANAPKGAEPLFAALVLTHLWKVYDAVCINYTPERVTKLVASLGISVDARELAQVGGFPPPTPPTRAHGMHTQLQMHRWRGAGTPYRVVVALFFPARPTPLTPPPACALMRVCVRVCVCACVCMCVCY